MSLPADFAERFRYLDTAAQNAAAARDRLVVTARASASLREIADALGISHTMVAKIAKRAGQPAEEPTVEERADDSEFAHRADVVGDRAGAHVRMQGRGSRGPLAPSLVAHKDS